MTSLKQVTFKQGGISWSWEERLQHENYLCSLTKQDTYLVMHSIKSEKKKHRFHFAKYWRNMHLQACKTKFTLSVHINFIDQSGWRTLLTKGDTCVKDYSTMWKYCTIAFTWMDTGLFYRAPCTKSMILNESTTQW